MKTKNFIISLLCILFVACEGEKIDSGKGGRALQLQADIDGLKTRATETTWEKDDAIGIYMVKAGQPLNASALRQNVKYITAGTSSFNPAKKEEEIILPFDGSNVDFISYYPYRENITNFSYPVDLSNQSPQSAIDLMYSVNAKNVNSKNPNVQKQFIHQLSKVVFDFGQDASINLNDLNVVLTNAGTCASFNLITGVLSAATERDNIRFSVNSDGSTAEAILLPESDLTGMVLWFIIGEEDEVYSFPLSNAPEITAFEKSTKYTYHVDLFSEKITVVTDNEISPWNSGATANIKPDPTDETPPLIKGSKKNPFTVAEAKERSGASGVWVEGYIVGSFASSINNFSPGNTGTATSNIAIADTENETDTDKIIPVNLSEATTSVRNALNIPENNGNVNKKVRIKGNMGTYFSVIGIRNPSDYSFAE